VQFSFAGAASVMAALQIEKLQRLSASEILGTPAACMLPHAPFYIGGDSRIECVVRAKNYVHMPVQSLDSTTYELQSVREDTRLRVNFVLDTTEKRPPVSLREPFPNFVGKAKRSEQGAF
jgi:hypothetical protein